MKLIEVIIFGKVHDREEHIVSFMWPTWQFRTDRK